MIRVIGVVLLGFLFFVLGLYTAYDFVQKMDNGSSFLLAGLSILLLVLGVFFLIYAGRLNEGLATTVQVDKMNQEKDKSGKDSDEFGGLLKRNNELLSDWMKTVEKRDRLRILKISEGAKESADKK